MTSTLLALDPALAASSVAMLVLLTWAELRA